MVRHLNVEDEESSEESEKISILVGTVTGKIEIFKLQCTFDYDEGEEDGFLGDLDEEQSMLLGNKKQIQQDQDISQKNVQGGDNDDDKDKDRNSFKIKPKLKFLQLEDDD